MKHSQRFELSECSQYHNMCPSVLIIHRHFLSTHGERKPIYNVKKWRLDIKITTNNKFWMWFVSIWDNIILHYYFFKKIFSYFLCESLFYHQVFETVANSQNCRRKIMFILNDVSPSKYENIFIDIGGLHSTIVHGSTCIL